MGSHEPCLCTFRICIRIRIRICFVFAHPKARFYRSKFETHLEFLTSEALQIQIQIQMDYQYH